MLTETRPSPTPTLLAAALARRQIAPRPRKSFEEIVTGDRLRLIFHDEPLTERHLEFLDLCSEWMDHHALEMERRQFERLWEAVMVRHAWNPSPTQRRFEVRFRYHGHSHPWNCVKDTIQGLRLDQVILL